MGGRAKREAETLNVDGSRARTHTVLVVYGSVLRLGSKRHD